MWNFLKVIFLSSVMTVHGPDTFAPGSHPIELAKPLVAISPGASISIDVTSMVPAEQRESILGSREWVAKNFQGRLVKCSLSDATGSTVEFVFDGHSSFSEGAIYMDLHSASSVPVDREFIQLTLTTDAELSDVSILWLNSRK